jgi:hypothetical protein
MKFSEIEVATTIYRVNATAWWAKSFLRNPNFTPVWEQKPIAAQEYPSLANCGVNVTPRSLTPSCLRTLTLGVRGQPLCATEIIIQN